MLAQTVRNNLTNVDGLNLRKKTTKFSSLFQSAPTVEDKDPEMVQVLMKAGLMKVKEDSILEDISVPECIQTEVETVEDEISEYIVENPNEVIVNFPIEPVIEMEEKLPFFKSLTKKLESIYCTVEPAPAV